MFTVYAEKTAVKAFTVEANSENQTNDDQYENNDPHNQSYATFLSMKHCKTKQSFLNIQTFRRIFAKKSQIFCFVPKNNVFLQNNHQLLINSKQ